MDAQVPVSVHVLLAAVVFLLPVPSVVVGMPLDSTSVAGDVGCVDHAAQVELPPDAANLKVSVVMEELNHHGYNQHCAATHHCRLGYAQC